MILSTKRLVLRDFSFDDWRSVLAYQQKPLYLRYYPWNEREPDKVRELVETWLSQQQETPRIKYQLAITLRTSRALIGSCGVRLEWAGVHEGDIGFELDPEHWGQGYASEAARAMVGFGFSQLGLHRIWARCLADNDRSARVLERLGMRLEGRLRQNEFFKGQWWDTLLYGLLAHEWQDEEPGTYFIRAERSPGQPG